jgi:hypothetical protein
MWYRPHADTELGSEVLGDRVILLSCTIHQSSNTVPSGVLWVLRVSTPSIQDGE